MKSLFKLFRRELFSLSTLMFVAVPLMMSLASPDGGTNQLQAKLSGMTSDAAAVVKNVTPDFASMMPAGAGNDINRAVRTVKVATSPVKFGPRTGGSYSFGKSSASSIMASSGPIFLSSL